MVNAVTSVDIIEGVDSSISGDLISNDPDAGDASYWADTDEYVFDYFDGDSEYGFSQERFFELYYFQNTPVQGVYGQFKIDQDFSSAEWIYTLDNDAARALGAGDWAHEYFLVHVEDEAPTSYNASMAYYGPIWTHVAVTVIGSNDAPIITGGAVAGVVSEDDALSATGAIAAFDYDASDVLSWSVDGSGQGAYGSLSINANGGWTYLLDNDSEAVQALSADDVVEETFTVTVDDGNGGTVSEQITITVAGANEAPVITGGVVSGVVTEDDVLAASGTLIATDADASDTLSWSVVGGGQGAYGALSIGENGTWTYVLDNEADAVQALSEGEQVGETFTVAVDDGNGGSVSEEIHVSVTGANEAPVVGSAFAGKTEVLAFDANAVINDGTLRIADGYGGFNWYTNGGIGGQTSEQKGDFLASDVHGRTAAWNGHASKVSTIELQGDGTFDFEGAMFNGSPSTHGSLNSITINGYLDGSLIGTETVTFDGANEGTDYKAHVSSLDGIDSLQIVANGTVAGSHWWAMDDFSYTVAPEVLTFDADAVINDGTLRIADGYGRFNWFTNGGIGGQTSEQQGDLLASDVHGRTAAWNGHASKVSTIELQGDGTFDFEGAMFNGSPSTHGSLNSITINGYLDGSLIGTETVTFDGANEGTDYKAHVSSLDGIDSLQIVANGTVAGSHWWAMDDFTYSIA